MTKEQIQNYEYCKKHLEAIKGWKLPFGLQMYGCGSNVPAIEYKLEDIHRKMNENVLNAIENAKLEIEKIISGL